ncbi:MAG: amidohydrolase family protein [Thermoguttaceae bacterium]|jgi:predicted TIM-barrel fold metal-dependent hydrolase|nr:amidohydrolase family protein [Thermoguttaceae bacterium]
MQQEQGITRRSWLKGSAAAAGVLLARRAAGFVDQPPAVKTVVIDCHAHFHNPARADYQERDRLLIEAADKLGIDQLCCSTLTPKRPATVDGFRECNRSLAEAIGRFPGRVLGYCYVNPGYTREAVDEVRRYVEDHGFIGVKLYNEHVCTDPVVAPVVELTIELRVPILHHAGHAHYPLPGQPNISDGGHLAELGRRYPEAQLICAHVGGGGDWEWTIKALRHAENVCLDTSGSVTDEGMIEMAADALGADRLLFGCDMSMTAGVGKIRAADLSTADKAKILGGNMQRILAKRRPS